MQTEFRKTQEKFATVVGLFYFFLSVCFKLFWLPPILSLTPPTCQMFAKVLDFLSAKPFCRHVLSQRLGVNTS